MTEAQQLAEWLDILSHQITHPLPITRAAAHLRRLDEELALCSQLKREYQEQAAQALAECEQGVTRSFSPSHPDIGRAPDNVIAVPVAAPVAVASPLSDEQIKALNCVYLHMPDWEEFEVFEPSVVAFARAIEAAHGIKEQA